MAADILHDYLRKHGHSVTQVRRAVFTALEHQEPVSMKELLARLPAVDRASVYRTVSLFEALGIVRRIQIGWKYKLELSEAFNYHHHHLTCTVCGAIIPLPENPTIEAALLSFATEYGFAPTDHQLEIQGICANCQQQ